MAPSALPYKKRTKVERPAQKFKPLVNVPVRAFSTSSMSAPERRALAESLRAELELVRAMQRRLEAAEAALTPMQRCERQCTALLRRLTSHRHGWVFREPVDVVKLGIPDYHDVIRHPMDLGTIGRKLDAGGYSTPEAFAADVRLTFSNAVTYNSPSTPVHKMTLTLRKLFEREWAEIERTLAAGNEAPRRMTNEEKQALSSDLQSCMEDLPKRIVDLLAPYDQGDGGGGEVEIDIDAIGDDTLIEVRDLLDVHLKEKAEGKRGNHQLRPLEEASFSETKQDCKVHAGHELLNKDVGAVNSSPLVSGHPPLQIKCDSAQLRSSCNSNSSSSDSSSSHDSDSGSSSGSDSDDTASSSENVHVELSTNNLGSH